ncbi:MAG: class I SAM-dependent methyltransferase, partial [Bacteroidia bacterium]|nr:class I SAM-dependent methyltransferase [Bacteroidia bacterium]
YRCETVENSSLPDRCCDLIAASQAAHWFDMEVAAKEFRRVARPEAVVALWGYTPPRFNPKIDAILDNFHFDVLGPYWDERRKPVDERYRNLYFPFKPIPTIEFVYRVAFNYDSFAGYLRTWSAVQNFIKIRGFDPVVELMERLKPLWKENIQGAYPMFLKMGYVHG